MLRRFQPFSREEASWDHLPGPTLPLDLAVMSLKGMCRVTLQRKPGEASARSPRAALPKEQSPLLAWLPFPGEKSVRALPRPTPAPSFLLVQGVPSREKGRKAI